MNLVFADLIAKGEVAVYMDDILIYSKHLKEHCQVVQEVLKRLEHFDLYLKPEKCEFEKDSMEYCQGPFHGGSYMDEGTFHIRIGLFPIVCSRGQPRLISYSMPSLLIACASPMSDDTGLYWYVVSIIPFLCMRPWELYFLVIHMSTCMVAHTP